MVSVYGLLKIYPETGMEKSFMRGGTASQDQFLSLRPAPASAKGFSLIELVVTMAIVLTATAIAVPLVGNAMAQYKLKAAVVSVTGAIQTTRYRAITAGYIFRVVFNSTNLTYQVQSDPTRSGTYTNLGSTVPITSSSAKVALDQDATLQFRPGGAVSATTGSMTMVLTLGGKTETIAVLPYGNINVTP